MLSPKRQRFVEEYLIDLNATQAAIRAGYAPKGAKQQGDRLLTYVDVDAAVKKVLAERSKANQISQERILEELRRMAFVDSTRISWIEDGEVHFAETKDLSEDDRRAIAEISETISQNGKKTISVKVHSKQKALELLGKHLGMFVDRHEIKVNNIADLFRADDEHSNDQKD